MLGDFLALAFAHRIVGFRSLFSWIMLGDFYPEAK